MEGKRNFVFMIYFASTSLSSLHLPGMRISTLPIQHLFRFSIVVLPQIDLAIFGQINQLLTSTIIQPVICGKTNFFFLNGRVDVDSLKLEGLTALSFKSASMVSSESSSAPASPMRFLHRVMLDGLIGS